MFVYAGTVVHEFNSIAKNLEEKASIQVFWFYIPSIMYVQSKVTHGCIRNDLSVMETIATKDS